MHLYLGCKSDVDFGAFADFIEFILYQSLHLSKIFSQVDVYNMFSIDLLHSIDSLTFLSYSSLTIRSLPSILMLFNVESIQSLLLANILLNPNILLFTRIRTRLLNISMQSECRLV